MYQVLIYGFPLILIAFEWGLKFLMSQATTSFAGPALAAAALSFLMPLTRPKVIEVEVPGHPQAIVTSPADNQLIAFVWLLVFAYLFGWAWSCYLSIQNPAPKLWLLDQSLVLGIGTYTFSLLLTLIKEKI